MTLVTTVDQSTILEKLTDVTLVLKIPYFTKRLAILNSTEGDKNVKVFIEMPDKIGQLNQTNLNNSIKFKK